MGFLGNLGDELGKKTGKAIGNKVFGSYADDVRVGYGDREGGGDKPKGKIATMLDNSHEEQMQYRQMEQEIKLKELDQDQQLFDEINRIEFDTANIQNNVNIMSKLVSIMESSYTSEMDIESQRGKLYDIASSKLDVGIAILRSIDPNNSMATFFEQKKNNIIKSHKARRNRVTKISLAVMAALILMLVLLVKCA